MARDRFEDLACYAPAERWQPTTDAFLQSATERLENGEHCYTHVEDGVLAHYGWLVDRQERTFMAEVHQAWTLPPERGGRRTASTRTPGSAAGACTPRLAA